MPGSLLAEPNVLSSTLGGEASGFCAEANNSHQTPALPTPATSCFDHSAPHPVLQHCRVKTILGPGKGRIQPSGNMKQEERLTGELSIAGATPKSCVNNSDLSVKAGQDNGMP